MVSDKISVEARAIITLAFSCKNLVDTEKTGVKTWVG